MHAFKRAILYLTRKKGRTALLAALLFLMSFSILLGISFKNSAQKEADRLQKSLASGFILEADTANEQYLKTISHEGGSGGRIYAGPMITEEMIEKICSLEGVTDSVVPLTQLAWTDLKLRPGRWAAAKADDAETIEYLKEMNAFYMTEEELDVWRGQIILYPCKNGVSHKNFRTGALDIVRGRNIEKGDSRKAVISEWLAKQNGLFVGDTFTVETKQGIFQPSGEPMKRWGEPVELEIAGLFHMNFGQKSSEHTSESDYMENIIYTDMDTYGELEDNLKGAGFDLDEREGYAKAEFFVEDPGKLDFVMRQVEGWDALDLENISVTADNGAYQAAAKPYWQIRFFALILLAAGVCGMGTVLYLTLRLWIGGRAREAGILISIGVKKVEILGQMLAECLLVSVAALALAFLLSGPAFARCAEVMERVTAPREDEEAYEVTFIQESTGPVVTKTSSDDVILERGVSVGAIGFTILFVCGISCIGTFLSFAKMKRLDPRKLLQS